MTPQGQARASRAWRGLPLAPYDDPQDTFYVMMWEQERMAALREAAMLSTLLAPLGASPVQVRSAFNALYLAQVGRYSAPEERLRKYQEQEAALKLQLRELQEQIALGSTGKPRPKMLQPITPRADPKK